MRSMSDGGVAVLACCIKRPNDFHWLDDVRHGCPRARQDSGMTSSDGSIPEASSPEPAQAKWFRKLGREIKEEYDRLHQAALQDPQRAGHGGEGTWVSVLKEWLPPAYQVVTRKYIVPEVGTDMFEMDIVVLHSSYPEPLRTREEILAGGVAAAFSVKLTLDASGIRDRVERAVALRRALKPRYGTPREEITAPFPVGLLAHSHEWKAPNSTPAMSSRCPRMTMNGLSLCQTGTSGPSDGTPRNIRPGRILFPGKSQAGNRIRAASCSAGPRTTSTSGS
jgi:hypothetical protein